MGKPFLFVGLDYEDPEKVVSLAEELAEVKNDNFGYKLNLDFIINTALLGNFQPLQRILQLKKPIFADLKMWNGKRTMVSIVENLSKLGVAYTNVYSLADQPFVKAVVDATAGSSTKILGLTVLTHYTDEYCQRVYGCSLKEAVRKFADIAYQAGCPGIILPGTMLESVRDLPIEKLVPAARPEWYGKRGDNYQEQETLVRDAITGGANLLVCSSPIRKSEDKKLALTRTLDELI